MTPGTLKAFSPGPTALRSTVFGPLPEITKPAISVWPPLSSAREDRLRRRFALDVDAGENLVAFGDPIDIVSDETVDPPPLLTVTFTLNVPVPVGVPEMTPVEALMLIPGGRPVAENVFGDWVAVTVKKSGEPELPDTDGAEFTTGTAAEFAR